MTTRKPPSYSLRLTLWKNGKQVQIEKHPALVAKLLRQSIRRHIATQRVTLWGVNADVQHEEGMERAVDWVSRTFDQVVSMSYPAQEIKE